MKIFIVGFPRTGTTHIYKFLHQKLGIRPIVFEPFNGEVVYASLYSKAVHDIEGCIASDIHLLEREARVLLLKNCIWLLDWACNDVPKLPFLGWYKDNILDILLIDHENILLKDVCIWPILPELVRKYKDVIFIVTLRSRAYVFKAFLEWYSRHTGPRRLLKILKLTARIVTGREFRNKRPASKIDRKFEKRRLYNLLICDPLHPRHFLGLGIFYRYFMGCTAHRKLKRTYKHFLNVFTYVYEKYIETVKNIEYYDNIIILKYSNLILEKDKAWLLQEIKSKERK